MYSTFIGFERLQELRRRPLAPWPAYLRAHPKANPRRVTVGEVVECADRPARERHALVVRAHEAYLQTHSERDTSKLTVRELLEWYASTSDRPQTGRGRAGRRPEPSHRDRKASK